MGGFCGWVTARMDVQKEGAVAGLRRSRRQHWWTCPQLPILLRCGPRSPTRVQVFVRLLGICACQATDRDLESVSAVKKMIAWICAPLTTDRDPASAIPDKKREPVTTVIFTGPNVFWINKSRNNYSCNFFSHYLILYSWANFACNHFGGDGRSWRVWLIGSRREGWNWIVEAENAGATDDLWHCLLRYVTNWRWVWLK